MAAIHQRYERLLEAGLVLAAELSLPATLQRIVELAADVSGPRRPGVHRLAPRRQGRHPARVAGQPQQVNGRSTQGDDLARAIRTVGQGQSLLDPAVTKGVLDRLRKGKHLLRDEKLARLSPQEERILSLVASGRTNKQIGEELRLAEKTIKNYVSSILAKLEVARRAEAAAYLARHTTTPGA